MNRLLKSLAIASIVFALQSVTHAVTAFNFEDPKGINTIDFKLDAPLESISGTATGVTGEVHFDFDKPELTKGTIVVDATSITVPNAGMMRHLHGARWINSGKFDTVTFEAKSISNIKKETDKISADITGTFTLHGESKEVTSPVTFTYLPGKLKERNGGEADGDLLVMRASFEINRSEFGIQPNRNTNKVADDIAVSFALVGYAAK